MEKELKVGDTVIFTDSKYVEHQALVTKVWDRYVQKADGSVVREDGIPGCNLVYVSGDDSKSDPYGRQLERATSIVHKSFNPAGAYCWSWPA